MAVGGPCQDAASMSTAIVSDLHLGAIAGVDVLRRTDATERLAEALGQADRVVVLGDLLELRERRAEEVLEAATPALTAIGEATAGRQLVLVPGNHDYELVSPALERERLRGRASQPVDGRYPTDHGELSRRVAALMPATDVSLAYPGLWLRDDAFATHGHYVDLHLTVPRVESIFAHAVDRLVGANGPSPSVDAYESAVAPVYAFSHAIAQSARPTASIQGGNTSREVWARASGGGAAGLALGGVAIPAAVAALNGLGIGHFRADISALELRRAGLRAMDRVVSDLGIGAAHVIFGHTHRAGPLPGEVEGWWLREGTRLHNTGSWILEKAFSATEGFANPYWPGRVTWLDDEGPPRFENVLEELQFSSIPAKFAA
jgi:predicted phosphodiesterase